MPKHEWLKNVFSLREHAADFDEEECRAEALRLVDRFERFLRAEHISEINQAFADCLDEIRDHILPIVKDPTLPATNNQAERQIRPSVIH